MLEETRSIDTPDGPLGVYSCRPDGAGPFPVVMFFHHGPGMDEGSKQAAARIAAGGHYVVAHDRYHRFGPWITADIAALRAAGPDSDEAKRFWGILLGTTDDMVATDVDAVLDDLKSQPAARDGAMGVIGYCIGARSVLRTMAAHPDRFAAGVALHPSFCSTSDADSPHLSVPTLPGHVYVGFGAEDKMQSVEANQPLIEAVATLGDRGRVEIHEGADHGFAVPGPAYQDAAADRSYEMALALFAKTLD
ncbi:MAG TPA: dienelactone hydrolase family protein [Acidimicrobiales bacterium]